MEHILWRISDTDMLSLAPEEARLIKFEQMGETGTETTHIGETEIFARFPVYESVVVGTAARIQDLPLTDDWAETKYQRFERQAHRPIKDVDFLAWKEALPIPVAYKLAAQELIAATNPTDTSERLRCMNCKGKATFETDCTCTFGGLVFIDTTEEEGQSQSLRDEGEADPACGTCHGSGKMSSDCPFCNGAGYMTKYPTLILTNELTGESRYETLDIVELIATGKVPVLYTHTDEQVYGPQLMIAKYPLKAMVSTYINSVIRELGVDPMQAVSVVESGVKTIEPERFDMTLVAASWRRQNGQVTQKLDGYDVRATGFPGRFGPIHERILGLQYSIAYTMSWPAGKILDDNGVAKGWEWKVRQRQDFATTLKLLTEKLAKRGYRLGCRYSFIATEESAPTFYVLDQDDHILTALDQDYRIEDALESALFKADEILEQLP